MKSAGLLAVLAGLTIAGAGCDAGVGLGSDGTPSFVEAGRSYALEGVGWHAEKVRVLETGDQGWVKVVLSGTLAEQARTASSGDTVWVNLGETLLARELAEGPPAPPDQ